MVHDFLFLLGGCRLFFHCLLFDQLLRTVSVKTDNLQMYQCNGPPNELPLLFELEEKSVQTIRPDYIRTTSGLHLVHRTTSGLHPRTTSGLHPRTTSGLHPRTTSGLHPDYTDYIRTTRTTSRLHLRTTSGLHGLHPDYTRSPDVVRM